MMYKSGQKQILLRFFAYKPALLGLVILLAISFSAILAPMVTAWDQNQTDTLKLRNSPSSEHLLGTDDVGRDIFTRLLYASRISLLVGLFSMLIQILAGVTLGLISGYLGGIFDALICRVVDFIMCFPFFVIIMFIVSITGPGMWKLIFIIGLLSWPSVTRIVRNEVLQIRKNDFVVSAKAMGLNSFEIISRHILPNIMAPILIASSQAVARGILTEASMSFLGIGIVPPTPSWGNMLTAASNITTLKYQWWIYLPPAIMVILTTISINLIAAGLQRFLSPQKLFKKENGR
jgi:peptide/nickel transport system permease protein